MKKDWLEKWSDRFVKAWKDPVGSKLIATAIIGIFTMSVALLRSTIVNADNAYEPIEIKQCTARGKATNVREGQGLNSPIVFQLNKNDSFSVIGTGKKDVVHGESGHWRRIAYKNKEGWMFSTFMICN